MVTTVLPKNFTMKGKDLSHRRQGSKSYLEYVHKLIRIDIRGGEIHKAETDQSSKDKRWKRREKAELL